MLIRFIRMKKNVSLPVVIIILIIVLLSSVVSSLDGGDFDVYLDAARKLAAGENIYQPPFVKGLQYYYSVFFAMVLVPFSYTVFITEFLWLLLSYFLLYRTWILVEKYFDTGLLTVKKYRLWLTYTALLALQFVMYNVAMIQVTIFLLWAIVEAVNLIGNNKPYLAGFLLAVAINVKIMPIIILAYLFYKGYFKTLITTIVCFVILLYLPAIFIGVEYNNFLLAEWWKIINPQNKEHLFETGIGMHDLGALLPVYLTETVGEMPFKRNVLNLPAQQVEWVINGARLVLLGISLFFFRSLPFKTENNKLKQLWEMAYFLLLIPLLLPHQQKYAFLFALPMVSHILYYLLVTGRQNLKPVGWVAIFIFILAMLFYSPLYGADVIGKFLFEYTQHYRMLSWATLALIPVALYFSPGRLQKSVEVK